MPWHASQCVMHRQKNYLPPPPLDQLYKPPSKRNGLIFFIDRVKVTLCLPVPPPRKTLLLRLRKRYFRISAPSVSLLLHSLFFIVFVLSRRRRCDTLRKVYVRQPRRTCAFLALLRLRLSRGGRGCGRTRADPDPVLHRSRRRVASASRSGSGSLLLHEVQFLRLVANLVL